MIDYMTSAFDHFFSAFFLGFIPVALISIIVSVVILLFSRNIHYLLYSLTFSILGSSLGLMLGASREPVVQVFLPAIITLISGLLVGVFPGSEAAKQLAYEVPDKDQKSAIGKMVLVGLAAMLLSSVMSSFWGSSIREIREWDNRRYTEWLEMYKNVRIPLELERGRIELESVRRELGLSLSVETDEGG